MKFGNHVLPILTAIMIQTKLRKGGIKALSMLGDGGTCL